MCPQILIAFVGLRKSQMFIAAADIGRPRSVGAQQENIPLLRSGH
jgi:hypothetical protein